jgi:hypothetical protein
MITAAVQVAPPVLPPGFALPGVPVMGATYEPVYPVGHVMLAEAMVVTAHVPVPPPTPSNTAV